MNFLLASLFSNFIYHSSIKESLKNGIFIIFFVVHKNIIIELKKEKKTKKAVVRKVDFKMLSSLRLLGTTNVYKKTSLFLVENFFNFTAYKNSLTQLINEGRRNNTISNKIKIKLAEIFHFNKYWLFILHSVILLNVLVLCLDRYPISKQEQKNLADIDYAIFFFYFAEIIIKIFAYGPSIFFKSPFNFIDFVIVFLNLGFEIHERFEHFGDIEAVRNLKVLRILRTAYYSGIYESFSFLSKGLIFALTKLRHFIYIILILVIIVSLIGKEIFAYRIRLEDPYELKLAHDP